MQSRSHHAQVSLVYAYVDYSSPGIEAFAARMGLLYGGVDFFAWRHCMETLALCRAALCIDPTGTGQNWSSLRQTIDPNQDWVVIRRAA
jgi:hypothetical protein